MKGRRGFFLVALIIVFFPIDLFAGAIPDNGNAPGAPPVEAGQTAQGSSAASSDPTIAVTPLGKVKGKCGGDVVSWRGIRYAQPPLGSLRFKAPVPMNPWEGVRDATAFGCAAPQPPPAPLEFTGKGEKKSEDCLFLNIWAKKGAQNRPVMVWYHGGAYMSGESSLGLYNGAGLARAGDVVVVSVNYRLGALGFLYFADIAQSAGLADDFIDNPGLRDQIAALIWIHDNIAAFGGDPGKVTIFGESAGGSTIITLLCAPAAKGLFHRAIAQSAAPSCIYGREAGSFYAAKFLGFLGLKPEEVGQLKDMPADRLVRATQKLLDWNALDRPGSIPFGPTTGTYTMPLDPLIAAQTQATAGVPLIIGTNHDEATLFEDGDPPIVPTTPALINRMLDLTNADKKARILSAYPGFPSQRRVFEAAGDAIFTQPSIQFAEGYSQYAPTWFYRFDYKTPLPRMLGLDATHGSEIVHVFHTYHTTVGRLLTLFACPGARHRVGDALQSSWVNFAVYGDPNGSSPGGGASWPAYETMQRSTRIFDSRITTLLDPEPKRREAWRGVMLYK